MQRRSFLKTISLASAGLLACPTSLWALESPYLVKVKGDPALATRKAVELLGGMATFVKPGQKVVIKPNMSFSGNVDSALNTHPLVVRELLLMCLEAKAGQIRVLDHAFSNSSLSRSGILPVCNAIQDGICFNLTQSRHYVDTNLKNAVEMSGNAVMRDVLEADVLIAVPVAKSHSSTGVSLALKGQMGLILDRNVMHSRYNLDTSIVDLAMTLKPTLTVIDATRVLATNGPSGPGKVLRPSEIIASRDPVAADALAVASYEWYGRKIKPRQVAHLKKAHERGLGRIDLENLNIQNLTV